METAARNGGKKLLLNGVARLKLTPFQKFESFRVARPKNAIPEKYVGPGRCRLVHGVVLLAGRGGVAAADHRDGALLGHLAKYVLLFPQTPCGRLHVLCTCVYIYICIYIYIHMYLYICVCIHIHIHIHIHIPLQISMYKRTHTHVCHFGVPKFWTHPCVVPRTAFEKSTSGTWLHLTQYLPSDSIW